MSTARKQRHETLLLEAKKAFAKHEIRSRSEGRWLLQERHLDGGWTWIMGAEIIALTGGALYVGGDIDFTIFAYYSDHADPESRVRWMGRCRDVDYYVAQKAHIGMGRELTDVFDSQIAEQEIQGWLTEAEEEYPNHTDTVVLRRLVDEWKDDGFPEDEHELIHAIWDSGLSSDFMVDRSSFPGKVLAPRVYYAHAALARLCDLLDREAGSQDDG
jgi:hypothetical protein